MAHTWPGNVLLIAVLIQVEPTVPVRRLDPGVVAHDDARIAGSSLPGLEAAFGAIRLNLNVTAINGTKAAASFL